MRGRRFHLRFLGIAGALAGLWWAGSRLVAPRLIRAAWEERSLRILNDLLEGRSRHPLDDYLASWQTFVDRVEPVLVVGLLLTWAALAFRVPDRIRAWNARLVERERASRPPKTLTPGEGLSVAVFFGLGAGVAAAAYMLVSNHVFRRAVGDYRYVTPDIVWMAPASDVAVFVTIGGLLTLVGRWWPRASAPRVVLAVPIGTAVFALLMVTGWFHGAAAAVFAAGLAARTSRFPLLDWERSRRRFGRGATILAAAVLTVGVAVRAAAVRVERRAVEALPPASAHAPDVLLLILDTVRARNLSLYGYERKTTPELVRLAGEGTVFDMALSTSPWSLPSHGSLFTGRYPRELETGQLGGRVAPIDDRYPTLAEILARRGYLTVSSTANLVFGAPGYGLARGFLRYRAAPRTPERVLASSWLGEQLLRVGYRLVGSHQSVARKRASTVRREFLEWIDETPERPFFAVLNFFDAHDPYLPPAPFDRRFADRPSPYWVEWGRHYEGEELDALVAAYDNSIAYVDGQVAGLVRELERRGRLDGTLLIVTSDHGEGFMEHGRMLHTQLYLTQLHVPLLMRFPGAVPAGARVSGAVSLADLPATILDLLDTARTDPVDPGGTGLAASPFPGRSLARHWSSGGERSGDEAGSDAEPVLSEREFARSLVHGRWHYLRRNNGAEQLFDLEADPDETHDRASDPEAKDALERMRAMLAGGQG